MRTTIIFLLLCVVFFTAVGQNGQKKQYHAQRLEGLAPTIDAILDDEAWQKIEWEGGFTQYEPYNGREASQPTFFKLLFDDNNLYVAIRALDASPDSIVTRLTRRDSEDGDGVGIAFDSYYDQRTAFIFSVSASGIKSDWVMSNDGENEDRTWDPNWWVKTSINEEGWVAEMRIPLSQLRFEKNGSGIWGLQVFRNIFRHRELSFWNHIPKDAPGMVRHCGLLYGIENLEPRKIFDLTPYTVASASSYPSVQGNPFRTGRDGQFKAGLDAKIGVSNNFTMDMTLLPDFGQVEADPSQVNLSAYETFFQEKRPFFIEGRNISSFSVGLGDGGIGNDNLFYSRRIGRRPMGNFFINGDSYADIPAFTRILGAAKVTGKTENGLSIAIIESVTAEEKAEIDYLGERSFETVEPLTNFFVGRVQKDINEGNTIVGGMFTSVNRRLNDNLSSQMHGNAFSGGLDFTQYFKDKTWMFNLNAAMSHVTGDEASILRTQRSSARYFQRPDASHVEVDPTRTSLTGTGGRMQFGRFGAGHWSFMAAMLWKSPEFEINDLGYMREADQILSVLYAGYRQWKPKGFYLNYNINMNTYTLWNFEGTRIVTGGNVNGNIRFNNYWNANGGVEISHGVTSTAHLRGGPSILIPDAMNGWVGFGTDSRKKFFAGLSTNFGLGAEGYMAHYRVSPSFTYKPFDNISFSFVPSLMNRFEELQYVTQRSFNNEARYLFASIEQKVISFSFRVNYTILPDLTIQFWGQPFVASGRYSDFKYITNPMADKFTSRFHVFTGEQIHFSEGAFLIDEDQNGTTDYAIGNPNFRFKEFLSNLVIRWEYNPGSSVYLVWSQNRSGFEPNGRLNFFNDLGDLFAEKGTNIFLIKFSYRIGVR
jgi:hypothetical protein